MTAKYNAVLTILGLIFGILGIIYAVMFFISGFDYQFFGITLFFIILSVIVSAINRKKKPKALDILSERYAKGEITKEEFDRMKKDLQ